jgi:hypothetical protein
MRRSQRIQVMLPITLQGIDDKGTSFQEKTHIHTLSHHGAGIFIKSRARRGSAVYVTFQKHTAKARLVWLSGAKAGLEFLDRSSTLEKYLPEKVIRR